MKIGDLVDIKDFFTLDTPMTHKFGGCYGYITNIVHKEPYEVVYYMVFLFDRQREYLFKDFELKQIRSEND
jgi:hypothetical protein